MKKNMQSVPAVGNCKNLQWSNGGCLTPGGENFILYHLFGVHSANIDEYLMLFSADGLPADGSSPIVSPIWMPDKCNINVSFPHGIAFHKGIAWGTSKIPDRLDPGDSSVILTALYA